MERLYYYMNKQRSALTGFVVTYIIATITNVITAQQYTSFLLIIAEMINFNNFSIVLMWVGIIFVIFYNIIYFILDRYVMKMKTGYQLTKILTENTEYIFDDVREYRGYSWGKDKTIICCDNIIKGWDPKQIVIDRVIVHDKGNEYWNAFEGIDKEYSDFMKSDIAKDIINHGNNNKRWMIEDIYQNYSKDNKKIYISLRETDYCTASFVWNMYKKDTKLAERLVKQMFRIKKSNYMPHSLCLHLVIVTSDEKVVTTTISNNKSNDYSESIAVTLGEQIEDTDFLKTTGFYEDFIERWVKRALKEEFGIDGSQYIYITGKDSINVLSFNYEGDIYNISLMVVLNVTVSYKQFVTEANINPERDKEYDEIGFVNLRDIPKILKKYKCDNGEKCIYHPSSYLRLYLTYIHYYGIKRFVKEYNHIR